MNEFRVPTVQVEAEVTCADGRMLDGYIYMPVLSAVHAGRMQPAEWINGSLTFFPFRLAPHGPNILLNKSQVVALSVPPSTEADAEEAGDSASDVPVRQVVVEAGGHKYAGRLVIDMPVSQQRVVDYMNRDEMFLWLHGETGDYFIGKTHISRINESEAA